LSSAFHPEESRTQVTPDPSAGAANLELRENASAGITVFFRKGSLMSAVIVSACLLGEPVRWHGREVPMSGFVKKFVAEHPEVKLIPVCPEQLGGLPTPHVLR